MIPTVWILFSDLQTWGTRIWASVLKELRIQGADGPRHKVLKSGHTGDGLEEEEMSSSRGRPERKLCPGVDFPWALQRQGGGQLWPRLAVSAPSRYFLCVPRRSDRGAQHDPRPHHGHMESALGRLGNKPKMGPTNAKNKSQFACRVCFLITLYFENVEPNRKAKNLHLGSPLVNVLLCLLYLALFTWFC